MLPEPRCTTSVRMNEYNVRSATANGAVELRGNPQGPFCPFRCQSRQSHLTIESIKKMHKSRILGAGEGSTSDPPALPLAPAKAFSRSGCGRIFSLYSRVMRERLSTGPSARRVGSGLSGADIPRPHDCADLVNLAQVTERNVFPSAGARYFGSGP